MQSRPNPSPKKRRFQSTGFGLERDVSAGDKLPPWKQKMFDRIRNQSKQHRQALIQRLEQQKKHNKNLSPNSKKQNAHRTIDSFKNALIEHEMKHFNQDSNTQTTKDLSFPADVDIDFGNLSAQKYKVIFAELASYLEEMELSDLRESYVASLEEIIHDQQLTDMQEVIANEAHHDPHVLYCPICCKDTLAIEYLNNKLPVYSCFCGAKFQARDKNLTVAQRVQGTEGKDMEEDDDDDIDITGKPQKGSNMKCCEESDVDIGRRMLKTLKNTLHNLMMYHSEQVGCKAKLNFAVVEDTGYLQAWCGACHTNEIVI